MSVENTENSSNTDDGLCRICGQESICEGLGVIRYDVPVDDPRFGKLFRCPNNPVEKDNQRKERFHRLSNLAAYADKTFANFVTEFSTLKPFEQASLERAFYAAANFADVPEGWLLLEGGYGCGKTHLAAAAGNACLQRGTMVLFVTVPDLLDHLRSAYGPSSEVGYDELFDRIRNVALLILDDLGTENASQWAQEKLFQLFNHRYSHRLPTIITTNADIDSIDPRIRSRLLDGDLTNRVKISAPDYRTAIQSQHDQVFSSLKMYASMTFDTFDTRKKVTPEERRNLELALQSAMEYAKQPADWFVITGVYGSGKTHLAAAVAHFLQQQGTEVTFVTVPDLLDYLRDTFNPQIPVSFDHRFQMVRRVPFLVLDDFGTEYSSTWAKEKLFQIMDYRYINRLPTVITTAKRIHDIDGRVRSRLLDERRCTIIAITTSSSFAERMKRD